ncbi:hypothetical protein ACFOSW_30200 [Paenibacillus sp. GCM10012303]
MFWLHLFAAALPFVQDLGSFYRGTQSHTEKQRQYNNKSRRSVLFPHHTARDNKKTGRAPAIPHKKGVILASIVSSAAWSGLQQQEGDRPKPFHRKNHKKEVQACYTR